VVARRVTVEVKCYSGYRASERPVSFVWAAQTYTVESVIRQWRTPEERGFLVRVESGERFVLAHHEHTDKWTLQVPETAVNLQGSTSLHSVDDNSSTPATRKGHLTDA
jgi:hypothetical protein